jgi:hypothetical protein
LNGEAAKWCELNKASLPLDAFDFTSLLTVGEAVSRDGVGGLVAGGVCANCGKHGTPDEMQVCLSHHVTCANCALHCPLCNAVLCLKCQLIACNVCGAQVCRNCGYKCGSCAQAVCAQHQGPCHVCEIHRCSDCLAQCSVCGLDTCMEHIETIKYGDGSSHVVCNTCRANVAVAT